MRRMLLSGLRHRLGRSVAVLVAVGVATTTFTVLTGASDTQRLVTQGTVSANFRAAYDVLVRPAGVQDRLESAEGVVRRDFLAGVAGGISLRQWREIAALPGVDVAAPVAVVGSLATAVWMPIPLDEYMQGKARGVFTMDTTWSTDRGLTRISPGRQLVVRRGGSACSERAPDNPFTGAASLVECLSTADDDFMAPWFGQGRWGVLQRWRFPFVLAAVDPVAEARLTGLDGALVSGRYLADATAPGSDVQVLAAASTPTDLTASSVVRHVITTDDLLTTGQVDAAAGAEGQVVTTRDVTAQQAYEALLTQLGSTDRDNQISSVTGFWSPSSATFDAGSASSVLRPATVPVDPQWWASPFYGTGWDVASPGSNDTGFRSLHPHRLSPSIGEGGYAPLVLRAVGVFDADRLRQEGNLARVSLGTFFDPTMAGADEASRAALGGQPLAPSGSMTSYLQAPPLLLTNLDNLPKLLAQRRYADTAAQAAAPISAIRIKVAGVTGPDPVSQERIRRVAQAISAYGLTVDITAGSSPSIKTIALPAGEFGRPALLLQEEWVKKGVALAILSAADRKSVALFVLILGVCALVVTNTTNASVRARRGELAVLACTGWPARRLFLLVLAETALVGLAAGILGSLLAWPLARLLDVSFSLQRALLAIPAAVILAVLAGLAPAITAARSHPGALLAPPVRETARAASPRTVTQLATLNVRRTPGRTALGAAALAIGAAALTLLLGLTFAFRGVLVGSLLGDAVSFETRAVDFIAVAAMLLLGSLGVADVLYLDIRENAAELATLRATGWPDATIVRLLITQGAILGLIGGVIGAGLGLIGTVAIAGAPPPLLYAAAAAAVASSVLIAAAAAALIARSIHRLPTAALLAGE